MNGCGNIFTISPEGKKRRKKNGAYMVNLEVSRFLQEKVVNHMLYNISSIRMHTVGINLHGQNSKKSSLSHTDILIISHLGTV